MTEKGVALSVQKVVFGYVILIYFEYFLTLIVFC